MDQPLGRKIGNWLEVEECIELMNGALFPIYISLPMYLQEL